MRAKLTSTSSISQPDKMHRLVIGTPLLIVAVFCFGFFMMHPSQTDAARSSATNDPANKPVSTATRSPNVQPVSNLPTADTSSSNSGSGTGSPDTTGSGDAVSASSSTGGGSSDGSGSNQPSPSPAPASSAGSGSASPPATSKAPAVTKTPAANNDGGELLQTVVNGLFGGR